MMVLTQGRPRAQAQSLQLDPARILGMAGAIAMNATVFMLLLVPIAAPPLTIPIEESTTIVNLDKKRDPVKIEPVPIVHPQPQTHTAVTTPVRQTQPQTPTPDPIVDTQGTLPAQDPVQVASIAPGPIAIPDPGPQAASQLEYASAPAPQYPHDAMRDGLEGTVILRVLVDIDGRPLSVEIQRSSGYRKLDEAAKRQVLKKWMFRPAIKDGQAIQVYGIVPVSFELDRG